MISKESSKEVAAALDAFKNLSVDGQRSFFERARYYTKDNLLNQYSNPQTTSEDILDLHKLLVQTCIDFINKRYLKDIDEVEFRADSLQASAKEDKWTPSTDSFLEVNGFQEDDNSIISRKIIGYSC